VIRESTALLESGEAVFVRLGYAAAKPFFDEAVDAFLDSGCDMRSSWTLIEAYRELIEKVNKYTGLASAHSLLPLQEYNPTATELLGLAHPNSPAVPLSEGAVAPRQTASSPEEPSEALAIAWDAGDRPDAPCVTGPAPDSAHALYERLRSASQIRPKGEFETTREYEAFKAERERNLVPDTARYCIELGGPVLGPVYDADRAEFTVRISGECAPKRDSPERVELRFWRKPEPEPVPAREPEYFEDVPTMSAFEDDPDTIILRLNAVPDVARRVKPLIGEFRYFVVGRVDYGRRAGERAPVRLEHTYDAKSIDFVVEELVIVRGAKRCVVARIPASRTVGDRTYFTVE
jgi:hypothetical protein